MFVEIRKKGKTKKYYLSHSYRANGKVKKIVRYLGSDLSEKELEMLKMRAESLILAEIQERSILEFELPADEINGYKRYERDIKISHLQKLDWKRFAASFSYNTNAIEGSTVAPSEVRNLLDKKEKPSNDDEFESVNVGKAVEFIRSTKEEFTLNLIKRLHQLCFHGTKPFAGQWRNVPVVIRDGQGNIMHEGAPADRVEELLEELCSWYKRHRKLYPPLLLAVTVHNQFEHIHPFQDGNGRVGRLLLNFILLRHSYPPIDIRYADRQRYYLSLRRYDKTYDVKPMLKFMIDQYKKQYG